MRYERNPSARKDLVVSCGVPTLAPLQKRRTMKSDSLGITRALRPRGSDSKLLAIALSGFVSVTGCGDDDGTAVTPVGDGGADSGASEQASSTATESEIATDGGSFVTQAMADAGTPSFESDAGVMSTGTSLDAGETSDTTARASTLVSIDGGGLGDAGTADLDTDNDGFSVEDGDCDDFNNTMHPGALEIGADGVDSNCDGLDGSAMTLVWSSSDEGDDAVDALAAFDADDDGDISLEEFAAGCAESAQLLGDGAPGIFQYHASCAGTNSCKGMVLQAWGELYEHSCRGSNYCAGWSCVQTAADQGRDATAAYDVGHCGYCHSSSDGSFSIPVQPSEDLDRYLEQFWAKRSDEYLRSLIAFGVQYVSPDGFAVSNMPGAYQVLSRAEIDTLMTSLRTMAVSGHQFDLPGLPAPVEPDSPPVDGGIASMETSGDAS